METIKRFTKAELETMHISKGELSKLSGIDQHTFDFALPQNLLDSFVSQSGLDYNFVLSTSFSLYNKDFEMISACKEVQEHITQYMKG